MSAGPLPAILRGRKPEILVMTPVEKAYLAMVIIALSVFAVTLAYASIVAGSRADKASIADAKHAARDLARQPEYKKAA